MAKPLKPKRNKYAILCAALASMNSIILGYDVAVISGAALFIKDDLKIDDTKLEILAGIINIYSLIGSLAAGRTSDWIGRRYTIVLASAIFFTGALIMGLAPNYALLMVGRFIAGIGVGYGLMIAPVYTAEVSPTSARGFLTSFPEVFINFGILLGYISNFAYANLPEHLAWRMMFLTGAIPPIFLGVGVLAMPESPRWLVMQGRLGEAGRVLGRTSDTPEEAKLRLAEIKEAAGIPESCTEEVVEVPKSKSSGEGVWKELLISPTPSVRRILVAGIGLQFFQQASGIDSVVLYGPRVFEKAGFQTQSRTKLLAATVSIGFTKTIFILVATFLLDRVGRRPLLLTSAGGMVVSLTMLATGLFVIDHHTEKLPWAVGLCVSMVLCFVAFFSIGLGPIAWVYSSEIFPLRLRAQGTSMGTATNRIMSGVITMTFISLYKAITIAGSFYLYAGVATAGWLFFYTFLPETKGRSLEEVGELFGGKRLERKAEAELVHGDVVEEPVKKSVQPV
ncbi:polyol transporter 5-like [Dioscorea cayenensis subsp. rotundata]|uniref:Polyol transporter 5-like n=1 Tax=Dioscorea cayennensis subsp. rotundata TaxID=55577 RepID=A0AB40AJX1_DIOCR|nr:polyol transporter 5-like [Dioscorea cayenensis subsp. rotundata]